MDDKLLVRTYNVELGDCVYCRIPKATKVGGKVADLHILIDCGSMGPASNLTAAIQHLKTELPDAGGGKKRLDLLVVTHEHKDHIAGFDPELFADIKIGQIWMNAAMNPKHPQAEKSQSLQQKATVAMRNLASLNLALSPELQDMIAVYGIGNTAAMEALRKTLPAQNQIVAKYVHAGNTGTGLGLKLHGAEIHVVGPEHDIDRFYLGKAAGQKLNALAENGALFQEGPPKADPVFPSNISRSDFRRLQSRMMSPALAFANMANKVINNTSVVLLIEWKGKRLLFVGDAEWNIRFGDNKSNGAWNVMWHERKAMLDKPIDFLKIGHHGSENATPWNDRNDGKPNEPGEILDAILPRPAASAPTARAVVSTIRNLHPTIPRSELLKELGERVVNVRNYQTELGAGAAKLPMYKDYEKQWLKAPQPWRTDCEHALSGALFVDVWIDA
jgi:hypothetical protein